MPYFTWILNETGREKIEVRLHENSSQTLEYKAVLLLDRFWEDHWPGVDRTKNARQDWWHLLVGDALRCFPYNMTAPHPPSVRHSFLLSFTSLQLIAEIFYWSSQTCSNSWVRRWFGWLLSCLVVTMLWITFIQAYMPHDSSENPSDQPNGPQGSPWHNYWPPRTPWRLLSAPLDPLTCPLTPLDSIHQE